MAIMAKLNKVAPQFVVGDVVKTAEYYRDFLGFKILDYFLDPPVFAMVERDEVELHFGKADGEDVKTNAIRRKIGYDAYIWTSDIAALYEEFKIRNVNIIEGPVKRQYGRREIVIKDCNDFKIAFAD
jgi:Glyoxalase/Bleomycin resistance protein/Dioxygenase superfamily